MVNKVLFVMEQYCDADPVCGPTNSEHLLVDAIRSTGLVGETKRFYFDQLSKSVGRGRMSLLLEECLDLFRPDVVLYTPLGGALGDALNPLPIRIREEAKMLLWLWDAKPNCGLETKWLPIADYLGIVDSVKAYLYYRGYHNVILAYSAPSPKLFYDRSLPRDIDVSFLGSVDPTDQRWPMRAEYTNYLRENGIDIRVGGGQRVQRLSPQDYATIMSRSKISLNFSRDGNGLPCLKSRVFEVTSCGALLMDDWGTDTEYFFEPGKDFIIYNSKEDLLRLVKYYLEHEEERAAIAKSGWVKAIYVHNAPNMWAGVFERMGFAPPRVLTESPYYQMHKKVLGRLSQRRETNV